ncbi:hypothetical protein SRB5_04710 [Streptomyces sp. RB5]|uniref:Uncharacterized protein n=1 Tax=Streptomyces smaragdinus TaxID=2585196 RepID=A0A7K0CAE7_9ACTN|nr:hypothetical protein [Streptomyces smaragdinus]MQY10363.1 hypothetical protein [Streptomyces smaragdinus]
MAEAGDLGTHWRRLAVAWGAGNGRRAHDDGTALCLTWELAESRRQLTVRLTTARGLLVAFMTDGQVLDHGQLATAAAAANAWNTEQLLPMLAVWDVRGPGPCLAGVCSLPLSCRLTEEEFAQVADEWLAQARQMFLRCYQVFQL